MSSSAWPDAFSDRPKKPPVQCIRCNSTAVILTKPIDDRTGEPRYRYRCLDDGSAWWVDEHGGDINEYERRTP